MYKVIGLIIAIIIIAVASLPNKVIVTSIRGNGGYSPYLGLDGNGCSVSTKGNIEGIVIEYTDEKCHVVYEK